MIEKNDRVGSLLYRKDPSCLFLPTADDSGRVHPGEFLFIKDPGDNIPSALREIRYSGSKKDSAGFSVTYNYLTQKPESIDSSRFFLEKNYCKLLTKKDFLERIERIVTRVRENNRGVVHKRFDIERIVSSVAAFEEYAGKSLSLPLLDKIIDLSFYQHADFIVTESPNEKTRKLAIRYSENLYLKNLIVAETPKELQTVIGKIMLENLEKIVEVFKRDRALKLSDSYGDR